MIENMLITCPKDVEAFVKEQIEQKYPGHAYVTYSFSSVLEAHMYSR